MQESHILRPDLRLDIELVVKWHDLHDRLAGRHDASARRYLQVLYDPPDRRPQYGAVESITLLRQLLLQARQLCALAGDLIVDLLIVGVLDFRQFAVEIGDSTLQL